METGPCGFRTAPQVRSKTRRIATCDAYEPLRHRRWKPGELNMLDIKICASGRRQGHPQGLDLHVAAGEVHAIMGPNGSGKSTLAQVMAGREAFFGRRRQRHLGRRTCSPCRSRSAPAPALPGLPVPGRDPRRIERLLPQGGGQCCAQASRSAGVRRDGFPTRVKAEMKAVGMKGSSLPLGERRLLGGEKSATRCCRWRCSNRVWRFSTRPTRASTSTPSKDRGRGREPPALARIAR